LGNTRLLEYGGLVWLLFHLFVLLYEETTLRASFGGGYRAFFAEGPRGVPRLSPWRGGLGGWGRKRYSAGSIRFGSGRSAGLPRTLLAAIPPDEAERCRLLALS